MSKNKVLFTGAGFSANFGFPLAIDVWQYLFNNTTLQSDSFLRNKMLDVFNYEDLYHDIGTMASGTSKAIFLKCIDKLFNEDFETMCIRALSEQGLFKIDYQKLKFFLSWFSGARSGSGYFFTTNQDLFIERLFFKEKIICPIVGMTLNDFTRSSSQPALKQRYSIASNLPGTNYSDRYLPSQDNLKVRLKHLNLEDRLKKDKLPLYFKLHGSIGWKYPEENKTDLPIVMGRSKQDQIDKEPLFSFYFEEFKKGLSQVDTALMVIGYSFSDIHINTIIVDAINNYGLRLHVVNTKSVKEFKDDLNRNKTLNYQVIYQALGGYYQATLQDIFPAPQYLPSAFDSKVTFFESSVYDQIKRNFFDSSQSF